MNVELSTTNQKMKVLKSAVCNIKVTKTFT